MREGIWVVMVLLQMLAGNNLKSLPLIRSSMEKKETKEEEKEKCPLCGSEGQFCGCDKEI